MGVCAEKPEHHLCGQYRQADDLRKKANLALHIASDYESERRLESAVEWYGHYQRCTAVYAYTRFGTDVQRDPSQGDEEHECARRDALVALVQQARNNWRYLARVHAAAQARRSSHQWCLPPRPTNLTAPQWDMWLQLVGQDEDMEETMARMGLVALHSKKSVEAAKARALREALAAAEVKEAARREAARLDAQAQAAAMAAASSPVHVTVNPNITFAPSTSINGATAYGSGPSSFDHVLSGGQGPPGASVAGEPTHAAGPGTPAASVSSPTAAATAGGFAAAAQPHYWKLPATGKTRPAQPSWHELASAPTSPSSSGEGQLPAVAPGTSSQTWPPTPGPCLPQAAWSGGSTTSSKPAKGVNAHSWELGFEELAIAEQIGEGSFGRVYGAWWHETPVAVKILIDKETATAGGGSTVLKLPTSLLAKLDEEACLLASLRHPNICNFLGVCTHPPCIVTEFCSRGSLTAVLTSAKEDPELAMELSWHRRINMALDAALGMLYLHTRSPPIVHRDLKSPNLLVEESWRVKVTDFNLSKFVEDNLGSRSSSSTGALNPRWLAPEVMRGERATKAGDVFAFGVVCWELLTWELPWANEGPWQLVNLLLSGGRLEIPPRERLPGFDTPAFTGLAGFVALIRRCWAQEAVARPIFEEIIQDLRELREQAAGLTGWQPRGPPRGSTTGNDSAFGGGVL